MKDLKIFEKTFRVNDEGMGCLNDLYQIGGNGEKQKEPNRFLNRKSTKEFILTLESRERKSSVKIFERGFEKGAWAHPIICYKYAGSMNAEFEVNVYKVFHDYLKGKKEEKTTIEDLCFQALEELNRCVKKGSFHGRGLAHHKREKEQAMEKADYVLKRSQPDMFDALEAMASVDQPVD